MKTLVLSNQDVQRMVRKVGVDAFMDQLIERLEEALVEFDQDQTEIPVRTGFYYDVPAAGLIEWMPLFQRGKKVLMKIVGYHPKNPARFQLPTIVATMSLFDIATGHLAALVDGTLLTAMRTGAASAVATRILARPPGGILGLVGCGAQALTQLHAISRIRDLEEVLIYDIDPAATRCFAARAAVFLDAALPIREAPVDEIVGTADILSVATSVDAGSGPVLADRPGKAWLHVNACGSDLPGKIELPKALLHSSFVSPDNLEQASKEGECQQLEAQDIGPPLTELVRRAEDFYPYRMQRTVFDSTGWALEDQVAIDLALQIAAETGVGTEIEIECIPRDPRHPYEFLTPAPSTAEMAGNTEATLAKLFG